MARYLNKEHMVCAMAMSRKAEDEYEILQKKHLGDIGEGLKGRAFVAPSSRYPRDQSPMEYICFIDTPDALSSLTPFGGDTCPAQLSRGHHHQSPSPLVSG